MIKAIMAIAVILMLAGGWYLYSSGFFDGEKELWPQGAIDKLEEATYEQCKITNGLTEEYPGRCRPYAQCYAYEFSQNMGFKEYLEFELTSELGQPIKDTWIKQVAKSVDACKNADFED